MLERASGTETKIVPVQTSLRDSLSVGPIRWTLQPTYSQIRVCICTYIYPHIHAYVSILMFICTCMYSGRPLKLQSGKFYPPDKLDNAISRYVRLAFFESQTNLHDAERSVPSVLSPN